MYPAQIKFELHVANNQFSDKFNMARAIVECSFLFIYCISCERIITGNASIDCSSRYLIAWPQYEKILVVFQ